jgi:hypothetical protein
MLSFLISYPNPLTFFYSIVTTEEVCFNSRDRRNSITMVAISQVLALATLQPDEITISGPLLDQLASLPAVDELIKPVQLPIAPNTLLIGTQQVHVSIDN